MTRLRRDRRIRLIESVRPWVLVRSAYYARLYGLDREDLRQEMLLRLWVQSARYDRSRSSPANWAELVCRCVAGNERAKRRAECRSAATVRLQPHDTPRREADPADRRAAIVLALLGDTPEAWAVVYRHGYDGIESHRSYAEVAWVMGVPVRRANTLLAIARRRLRRMRRSGRLRRFKAAVVAA